MKDFLELLAVIVFLIYVFGAIGIGLSWPIWFLFLIL